MARALKSLGKKHIPTLKGVLILVVLLGFGLTIVSLTAERLGREIARSVISDEEDIEPIEGEFASDELLVKFKTPSVTQLKGNEPSPQSTGIAALDEANRRVEAIRLSRVARPGRDSQTTAPLFTWYKVKFRNVDAANRAAAPIITRDSGEFYARFKFALRTYRENPDVEEVEPNYVVHAERVPNDPYYRTANSWGQGYDDLWGLKKIKADQAWDKTVGSTAVTVAVIDTGVDRNHGDIRTNMWVNTRENPSDGADNDGNGYVDDYYGWDWVNGDNDPMDDNDHGTHVAGTIAAVGNNGIGVAGVAWSSRLMALKFLSAEGSGYTDNGARAIQYAVDNGARIASNSWGGGQTTQIMSDAIRYAHGRGLVNVFAAGNSNVNALNFWPAGYPQAITIAASDPNDGKASFSNWGEKIDVAAPGVGTLSLNAGPGQLCENRSRVVGGGYCWLSGTSMATPHVSGLAALLLTRDPSLTHEQVRQVLRWSADDLGEAGKDRNYGYGRINAAKAITAPKPLAPYIVSPVNRQRVTGRYLNITGLVPGPNFSYHSVEMQAEGTAAWQELFRSTTQVVSEGPLGAVDVSALSDGNYNLRLKAVTTDGRAYYFEVYRIAINNLEAKIEKPARRHASQPPVVVGPSVEISGVARTLGDVPFGRYTLEYGQGAAPTSWSTSGFTLAQNGTKPVSKGVLGTWNASSLVHGGVYTLRLSVFSAGGGVERATTVVQFDLVAPEITILSPPNEAIFDPETVRAQDISASASDMGTGVTRVEAYVNSALFASARSDRLRRSWNIRNLSAGDYTITVQAFDGVGNKASKSVKVTVTAPGEGTKNDKTPPTVVITNPKDKATYSRFFNARLRIEAGASDNIGVTKMEAYVNGALVGSANSAELRVFWSTRQLPRGAYTITVKAYDKAGNVGSKAITVHLR